MQEVRRPIAGPSHLLNCGLFARTDSPIGENASPIRENPVAYREESTSAAAAGGAAALADVAAAGRAHLRAAGHAQRRVGSRSGDQLEELGRGVRLLDRLRALRSDLLLHRGSLDRRGTTQLLQVDLLLLHRRGGGGAAVTGDLGGALL